MLVPAGYRYKSRLVKQPDKTQRPSVARIIPSVTIIEK